MSKAAKYTSFEGLRSWWESHDNTKFAIYHGAVYGRKNGSHIVSVKNLDDKEDAWEKLTSLLQPMDGGIVTIVTSSNGTNGDVRQAAFEIPSQKSAIAGVQQGGVIGAAGGVDAYIDMRLKMADMQRKIDDLEAERYYNQNPTWKDQALATFAQDPVGSFQTIAQTIAGFMVMAKGQGGVVNGAQPVQTQSEQESPEATQVIEQSLQQLAEIAPLEILLPKLLALYNSNPVMAKQMLGL